MLSFTDAQLNTWLAAYLWPLVRILGVLMVTPMFGHRSTPVRIRIGLGVFITLVLVPTLPAPPDIDIGSWQGLFVLVQQILIGISIGFVVRVAFAALDVAGEIIGLQMGLGFASFFDPQTAGQSLVLARFFNMLGVLIFVVVNGHLLLLDALAGSFHSLPVSAAPLAAAGFRSIAAFGGTAFSIGLQLALPLIAIMLMTNLALGILTRASPQLNIFAIGFPITLSVGLITLNFSLPYFALQFERIIQNSLEMAATVVKGY